MISSFFRQFLGSCLIVMSLLGVLLGRAQAASPEELLPATISGLIISDNLAATAKAWQATSLGQLLTGDSFAPLRKAVQTRNIPTLLHLRPWFGFDWQDLSAWDKPAALVVFPLSEKESGIAWVFFGETKPEEDTPWRAGEMYFQKKGLQGQSTYLQKKTYCIVALNPETAKALSQAMDGAKHLTAMSEYVAIQAIAQTKTNDSATLRWWARPLELWSNLRNVKLGEDISSSASTSQESSTQESSAERVVQPDWLEVAKRQGGEAFVAAGGRIMFPASGETEIDFQSNVLVKHPLNKAMRLCDFQVAARQPLPDWIKDTSSNIAFWGWNCPEAIKAFGNLFDDLSEPGSQGEGLFQDMLDAMRDDPEGPRVDLMKDLFSHLGPAVYQVVDHQGDGQGNRQGTSGQAKERTQRSLLAFQCQDVAQVEKVLKKYYANDKDVTCDIRDGRPMWSIGPGKSLFVEGNSSRDVGQVRAALLAPSALIVASDPEMLAPRSSATPLAKNAAYMAVARWWETHGADQAIFLSFLQTAAWLEEPYRKTRDNTANTDADWAADALRFILTGACDPVDGFPLTNLPDYQTVRKHLPAWGSLWKSTDAGWELHGAVLRGSTASP